MTVKEAIEQVVLEEEAKGQVRFYRRLPEDIPADRRSEYSVDGPIFQYRNNFVVVCGVYPANPAKPPVTSGFMILNLPPNDVALIDVIRRSLSETKRLALLPENERPRQPEPPQPPQA